MSITLNCEHCDREIKAPDEAAGKRGKCPHCGGSNYIPVPVSEDDLPDLAPLDEGEESRNQAERDRIRKMERDLIAESGNPESAPVPLEDRKNVSAEDLHHFVVNYCLDFYESRLDRLPQHVAGLKKLKDLGLQAVADFAGGKVKEPALNPIPPRVLQGVLAQLRDQLKG